MKKRILALSTAAVLALSLTACGSSQKTEETTAAAADTTAAGSEAAADTTAASGEKTVIKLGVVGENNEQWQPVIEKLAEENIDLELVKFAGLSASEPCIKRRRDRLKLFPAYQHILRMTARTTDMIFPSSVRPSSLR